MQVVYYKDDDSKNCPVKVYLSQYVLSPQEKAKFRNKKMKLLTDIDNRIKLILQEDARPVPPISEPLHDYSFSEIKARKNSKTLIRIFYFRHADKMVLLNAIEKPENYDTSKERKRIDRELNITDVYRCKFIKNPNNYEEYK